MNGCKEQPAVVIVADQDAAGQELASSSMRCPSCSGGSLRPWGHRAPGATPPHGVAADRAHQRRLPPGAGRVDPQRLSTSRSLGRPCPQAGDTMTTGHPRRTSTCSPSVTFRPSSSSPWATPSSSTDASVNRRCRTVPAAPREDRHRACPQGDSTPVHDGHTSSPATSNRSASTGSLPTITMGALQAPSDGPPARQSLGGPSRVLSASSRP